MQSKRNYIILIFMLFGVMFAQSQEKRMVNTLEHKIYFRNAERYVDSTYRENAAALDKLKTVISAAQADSLLLSIEVQGWASPLGFESQNVKLADNRAKELTAWVQKNCSVEPGLIKQIRGGVNWNLLRDLLAASTRPYRQQAIQIIDNVPVTADEHNRKTISERQKRLMALDGGRAWADMSERFFPDTRCCFAVVVHTTKPEPAEPEPAEPEQSAIQPQPPVTPDSVPAPAAPQPDTLKTEQPKQPRFPVALRTNLLEDILLVPNVGIEVALGKQWSAGLNWMYAWWKSDRRHRYWRVYGGDIYTRKYFGKNAARRNFTGHHLGLYGQVLTYDFEWGKKGIMGGIPGGNIFDKMNYGAGIEYGYALPIAKRLNLDFSLGLGYLGGEYREYLPIDDCYVWQATKRRHWFGPTKAEVSLVWVVPVKKGGASREQNRTRSDYAEAQPYLWKGGSK